jgi:adenylylsulfate kinase
MIILIMGLPGSGKTTLAKHLVDACAVNLYMVTWLNADRIRTELNDWDFSVEGRTRQAMRVRERADNAETDLVIIDMVAALPEQRTIIDPYFTVYMDTVQGSVYEDTNQMFVPPEKPNMVITSKNAAVYADIIMQRIKLMMPPRR